MVTVYGSAVEPGYTLDENSWLAECPSCKGTAKHRSYERCEGSVNVYTSVVCQHCGYHEDDGQD